METSFHLRLLRELLRLSNLASSLTVTPSCWVLMTKPSSWLPSHTSITREIHIRSTKNSIWNSTTKVCQCWKTTKSKLCGKYWRKALTGNTLSVGTKVCNCGSKQWSCSYWWSLWWWRQTCGLWSTWSSFSSTPCLATRQTSWSESCCTSQSVFSCSILSIFWTWLPTARLLHSPRLETLPCSIIQTTTWMVMTRYTPFQSSSTFRCSETTWCSVTCWASVSIGSRYGHSHTTLWTSS